jgi:hypothetical protein
MPASSDGARKSPPVKRKREDLRVATGPSNSSGGSSSVVLPPSPVPPPSLLTNDGFSVPANPQKSKLHSSLLLKLLSAQMKAQPKGGSDEGDLDKFTDTLLSGPLSAFAFAGAAGGNDISGTEMDIDFNEVAEFLALASPALRGSSWPPPLSNEPGLHVPTPSCIGTTREDFRKVRKSPRLNSEDTTPLSTVSRGSNNSEKQRRVFKFDFDDDEDEFNHNPGETMTTSTSEMKSTCKTMKKGPRHKGSVAGGKTTSSRKSPREGKKGPREGMAIDMSVVYDGLGKGLESATEMPMSARIAQEVAPPIPPPLLPL